jgi:hypothetical protein
MPGENDTTIPKLIQGKKTVIQRYHLDSGTWICVDGGMVQQADPSHPSFALQFPFDALRLLEQQQPDIKGHYHCPSCSDISPGIRSRIVEHVMGTHVSLNVNKFLEKIFWMNQGGQFIKEKFGLSDDQMRSVREIGNHVRKMDGLLATARDALNHAQKAKVILGTELLDMVATRTRQQALADIIKNGQSEADAFREARAECKTCEAMHPGCTFTPSHLESVHVRKSPKGGAGPVKIDVYIEGIDTSTGALTHTEVREIRAKAVKKGCATPVAEMICGEASAVLLAKGMLSKFVISCDMAIPFWKHLANHQLASSFRVLRLGKAWQSRFAIGRRHGNGYATTLADGMHVWAGFTKGTGTSYSTQVEVWLPRNGEAIPLRGEPDRSATFPLEFRQLPKTIVQYDAFADQVVTILCALCGVKRGVEAAKIEQYRRVMKQQSWSSDYEAFEQYLTSISNLLVSPIESEMSGRGLIVRNSDIRAMMHDRAVAKNNARARLLGNQWTIKLILRLWPQGLEENGIAPSRARAEMERAFLANGADPKAAIAHLNASRARGILGTLQNTHPDRKKRIMQHIISMLKGRYVPVYHDSPYLPFTQKVGDKTDVSPITPTQEILIGLETVAVEALDLIRRGIKVGKIKGGGVERHWNALHGLLASEPGAIDAVCEALDWFMDLA